MPGPGPGNFPVLNVSVSIQRIDRKIFDRKIFGVGKAPAFIPVVSALFPRPPNQSPQPTRGSGLRFCTARFRPTVPCHSKKRLVRQSAVADLGRWPRQEELACQPRCDFPFPSYADIKSETWQR